MTDKLINARLYNPIHKWAQKKKISGQQAREEMVSFTGR